jgi:hypothetical protein
MKGRLVINENTSHFSLTFPLQIKRDKPHHTYKLLPTLMSESLLSKYMFQHQLQVSIHVREERKLHLFTFISLFWGVISTASIFPPVTPEYLNPISLLDMPFRSEIKVKYSRTGGQRGRWMCVLINLTQGSSTGDWLERNLERNQVKLWKKLVFLSLCHKKMGWKEAQIHMLVGSSVFTHSGGSDRGQWNTMPPPEL